MKMFQAVVVRDQSLKQALIERFGDDKETIAKINAAFDVGRERWTGELVAMFGDEAAAVALDMLQKEPGVRSAAE